MMCAALMAEYEQALVQAASCTVGKDQACAVKVATTLRCASCETWVADSRAVDAVHARFVAAGCEGCAFRLGPDGKCSPGVCVPLTAPMCVPSGSIAAVTDSGTCGNAGGERICPDGLMTGTPCSSSIDFCLGGGHLGCVCQPGNPTWTCR
jgi:hypothetical protein